MGLPGAGKTTLANALVPRLNAVHFNADEVRRNINKDLGFSEPDRVEQAWRMGWLCDQVVKAGGIVVAEFICPTEECRTAFNAGGKAFIVWADRIQSCSFEDTNTMFSPPTELDVRVTSEGAPEYWADQIFRQIRPIFDPKMPTALLVGRYQPFHDGHKALLVEGLNRVGQVCVAVRDTGGTDEKNPFNFEHVRAEIEHGLREYEGRYLVVPLPNVTNIFYGRDVGYAIEQISLDQETEKISATDLRRRLKRAPG